ncbi:hypothetical protein [Cytobacillus depressus]|uniref:hypothetical protein n=1 Tax=Cytobacillus depressus TaxID=1602942 RepID=UPI001BA6E40C|nr:hypothetical protein [Cytobacillus depressus]
MRIVHTLLFMLREKFYEEDLIMAGKCFETLSRSDENTVVIYNKGSLDNATLKEFLNPFNIKYHILGDGRNIGIPQARQKCFEYVWGKYPETPYISEIHLDMLFPTNWYSELIQYLENNDEPLISPGIITATGDVFPKGNGNYDLPKEVNEVLGLLERISEDKVIQGFVHPVIHRVSTLKSVGGYDVNFLTGMQAYEDDSLLLGYLYFMGTRTNWYPKVCFKSFVYHAYMGQRITLENIQDEHRKNLEGLFHQYGAKGLKQLSNLHILDARDHFKELYELNIYEKKDN